MTDGNDGIFIFNQELANVLTTERNDFVWVNNLSFQPQGSVGSGVTGIID